MSTWHRFIGLPYLYNADPTKGEGADCFNLVWHILATEGVPHPPFQPQWRELAEQGGRRGRATLLVEWRAGMKRLPESEQYALTLFRNRVRLGVGIVVDEGLLIVDEIKGVRWIPLTLLKPLVYWTFR